MNERVRQIPGKLGVRRVPKYLVAGSQFVEASGRPHPQAAGVIGGQRKHMIARERCRVCCIVTKTRRLQAVGLLPQEASASGPDPQATALVFVQSVDGWIEGQPFDVGCEIKETLLAMIETQQPRLRSEP